MDENLIDDIYEAAFLPERFIALLDRLGEIVECDQAFVFSTDGQNLTAAIGNPRSQKTLETAARENWMRRNPQADRTIALAEPRFITDHDLFSDEEIASSVYYRDFLDKVDAHWGTGTLIRGPSGDNVIYSIHRTKSRGPLDPEKVAQLTKLRPHLARSGLMAARLRMNEARAMVSALAELGLPAATVTAAGRLHVANELFRTVVPTVLADFRSRLQFTSPDADAKFVDALTRQKFSAIDRGSVTFPARAPGEDTAPCLIHLVPMTGNSRDIFSGASFLLVAVPVSIRGPDALILEGLFDLTVAEAQVARGIAEGKSIEMIAQARRASVETVRTQLKSVMQKTGTHRQHELAALLSAAK